MININIFLEPTGGEPLPPRQYPRSVGLAGQRWASCVPPSVEDDILLGSTKCLDWGRGMGPKGDGSTFGKQHETTICKAFVMIYIFTLCQHSAEQVAWQAEHLTVTSHFPMRVPTNVPHDLITTWE